MSNDVVIKVDLETGSVVSGAKTITQALDGVGSKSDGITGRAIGMWSAVGNIIGNVVTNALGAISGAMDKAIAREDTLRNFPKVMKTLGYETDVADKAINSIKDHLDGLPSSTQAIASFVQQLTATTGNLERSTKIGLGFNDMMLAGGASAEKVANAQRMFNSMLASGKPDMEKWLSLVETAPGQMDQLAKSMLGANANQNDLREAIKDGVVSFDDLCDAIIRLDTEGGNGVASFEEQARAATGGIGTAIENVNNRIAAAIQKVLDYIGQENISGFIDTISRSFSGIADFVIEVMDSIREAFDFDAARQAFDKVASAFSGAGGVIQSVGKTIGTVIGEIANVFVRIVDAIAPFLPLIAKVATVLLLVHKPAQMLASVFPKVASAMELATISISKGGTASNKLASILGKLGGIASGVLTAGIMAGVAAITIIIDLIGQAIERHEAYVKATDGVVEASKILGDSSLETVSKITGVVDGLRDAASAAQDSTDEIKTAVLTSDELIEKQGELVDKMTDKFRSTEETNATLGVFAEKIAELAGNCDGSAEKLAELQGWLDAYNEIAGTSYTITDNFSGALDISTEKLLENAEAFKERARAAAAQEILIDMYKEQFEIESSLSDAEQAKAAAWNQMAEEQKTLGYNTQATIDTYSNACTEVDRLTGLLDSNTTAIDNVASAYINARDGVNQYNAQAITEAVRGNEELANSLADAGHNLDDVGEHWSKLGMTAEQAADLTAEQAVALSDSWGSSLEDVVAMCQQMGIDVPAGLQGAMSAAEAVMQEGGRDGADAWVRSMTIGQYDMVAAAAAAKDMSVAQFVVAAQQMGYNGAKGVADYAQSILNGSGAAESAATTMVNNAISAAESATDGASNVGFWFSQGAASGIDVSAMEARAKTMVRNAIDAAAKEAAIASPSKVMIRFGRFFAQGAAIGVSDDAYRMALAATDMVRGAIDASMTVGRDYSTSREFVPVATSPGANEVNVTVTAPEGGAASGDTWYVDRIEVADGSRIQGALKTITSEAKARGRMKGRARRYG